MKDLLEALAVFFGGIAVLALVLALIAGSWWLVGIAVAWVYGLVMVPAFNAPPLYGWQVGILLFTLHIVVRILIPKS